MERPDYQAFRLLVGAAEKAVASHIGKNGFFLNDDEAIAFSEGIQEAIQKTGSITQFNFGASMEVILFEALALSSGGEDGNLQADNLSSLIYNCVQLFNQLVDEKGWLCGKISFTGDKPSAD